MISNPGNPKVKLVKGLQKRRRLRNKERLLVVEGTRLVHEALVNGLAPQFVFFTDDWAENTTGFLLREALQEMNIPAFQVSNQVMASCADTTTSQGVLAVIPFPRLLPPKDLSFVLLMDQLRDPGNMGSILRTAAAAGTELVILVPGSVDPYNPKVLRGGMGAHFRLPVLELEWDEIEQRLRGLDVWVAAARDGKIYNQVDLAKPVALIVGNEARGAGDRSDMLAKGRIVIPMTGRVESLNVSVAAGILLLEVVRQRGSTS